MAWELKKVEYQRKELLDVYLKGRDALTELCSRFGVSRPTAYKWIGRYKSFGNDGLKDQSKAPISPNRLYDEDSIKMAIDLN